MGNDFCFLEILVLFFEGCGVGLGVGSRGFFESRGYGVLGYCVFMGIFRLEVWISGRVLFLRGFF